MKYRIKYLILIIVISLLSACNNNDDGKLNVSWGDLERISQSASRVEDRVDVQQLADWIIESRQDYLLIDIRDSKSFQDGHIKGAENVPITVLTTPQRIAGLPADRKVIVYSNGSENAAKAAVMLRLTGLDSYLLSGGYNAWQKQILSPAISPQPYDDEAPEVAEKRAISCYFSAGGASDAKRVKVQKRKQKQGFMPPVSPSSGSHKPLLGQGC